MGFLDQKGRLFGKVSVIDLLIVVAVIGLGFSYVYKHTSSEVQQIITANTTFYVTFLSERVRIFTSDAVDEGDVFYKQNERQPFGTVVRTHSEQAYSIMLKSDGTAVYAPMEDRINLYITLAVSGSINDIGYYVNGNLQATEGGDFNIQSNRLMLYNATVLRVSETLD